MEDIILTVNKIETSQSAQYTNLSDGNQWLDVNLALQNTGSSQEYITTLGHLKCQSQLKA